MSFEMLFVSTAAAQKVPAQEGQAKNRGNGAEGAFSALMALALTALFGGGSESEVIAKGENAVPEAVSGEKKATEVTLTRSGPEILWSDQGEIAAGESRSGDHAKVAGPVEVDEVATETGGHMEPMVEDLPVPHHDKTTATVQRAWVTPKDADRPEPLLSAPAPSGHEESPEAATEKATNTVTAVETAEVATAPGYQFQSFGGRDVVPQMGKAAPAVARQAQVEPTTSAGDRPPTPAKPEAVAPPVQTPESGVPASTTKAVAAEPGTGEASPEGSFTTAEETDEDTNLVKKAPAKPESSVPEFQVNEVAIEGRTTEPRAVADRPEPLTVSVERDASPARSLQNARAISQTLLEESLKRLPRSVELRLDPPQLGSVTAILSQRGQDVTVKFVAHTGDAQRMLQEATGDLARSLGEKGLVLTGFSVDPGFRDDRGQERRENAGKPGTSRYGRAARLAAVGTIVEARQVAGSFNWLA